MISTRPSWTTRREQLEALDVSTYQAIATTPTPDLDRYFGRLSRAADHSRLWMAIAAGLALTGPRGRSAAIRGLATVAVTSAAVNIVAKPIGGRRRPDRAGSQVPFSRHVSMPRSTSFPSGHAASAFAFATGVGDVLPAARVPLDLLATLVAYSRVHTGVHYPGDVIAGALLGGSTARLVGGPTARLASWVIKRRRSTS